MIRKFKLDGIQYGFIPDLDEMSFGEYDLDTYIGNWKEIEKAMAVLYRPVVLSKGDKYVIEDYQPGNYDVMNYILSVMFSAVVFFYNLGIDLCSYDQLYSESGQGQLDGRTNFTRKYGWYNSIYALSKGDITKFENITKLNIHKCLYYLSFEKRETRVRK